jgi:two-component system chemotaxis sensor kinase CheA
MDSKEEEYKEIFLAEALENYEELNRLMTELEKNTSNKNAVNAIFRITHTLKGNAAGMGFEDIGKMSHTLEDLFGEVRAGNLQLNPEIFNDIFKAIDVLGGLINALKTGKTVSYRGIKTKLEVILKKSAEKDAQKDNVVATDKIEDTVIQDVSADIKLTPEIITKPVNTKKGKHTRKYNVPDEEATPFAKPAVLETTLPAEKIQAVITPAEEKEETPESQITFSDVVQVPVKKLDNLLNLVSELTIERDRIIAMHTGNYGNNEYSRLHRISSDLQYSVMDVRLVQVGFLFNKFHRVVRDAAAIENKKVTLKLEGTDTEIDRNVLQIISDSLIHLIRNAVGHGIETPENRRKAGKPETGVITLRAKSESDAVMIGIQDDGKGIDYHIIKKKAIEKGLVSREAAENMSEMDIIMFIFEPGFSSMDQVTAISGRGVGMDVVKRALDSIGGNISVETRVGTGTCMSLSLPSSMAVKGTLLFELDKAEYAIPLTYTEAVVSLFKADVHKAGSGLVATHLGKTISIVFLKDLFVMDLQDRNFKESVFHKSFGGLDEKQKLAIIIVSYNNRKVGFVVDKLLQQKEIVEKPLMKPVDQVKFISGVTILGNGNICLVLNIAAIINHIFKTNNTSALQSGKALA